MVLHITEPVANFVLYQTWAQQLDQGPEFPKL